MMLSSHTYYNSKLATVLTSTEDSLKDKHQEIWRCIHSLVETANISPQVGLSLALQSLNQLPNIPWDLSY